MDRAIDGEFCEVRQSAPQKIRELLSGHFSRCHGKFPMPILAQTRNVARDPYVVRRISEHHLCPFASEEAFIAARLESVPAQQKMCADLPAVSGPRYRGQGAIDLGDSICFVRLVLAGDPEGKIDLGHLEAGDRHIEIRLDGKLLQFQGKQLGVPSCLLSKSIIGDDISPDLYRAKVVDPDSRDVCHAKGRGSSNPRVAGYDTIRAVDQNGADKAKLLDAGGDLFDLPWRMRAGIFEARFELARVSISDGQRPHGAPQAPVFIKFVQFTNCESEILRSFPFLLPICPFPRSVFPLF